MSPATETYLRASDSAFSSFPSFFAFKADGGIDRAGPFFGILGEKERLLYLRRNDSPQSEYLLAKAILLEDVVVKVVSVVGRISLDSYTKIA